MLDMGGHLCTRGNLIRLQAAISDYKNLPPIQRPHQWANTPVTFDHLGHSTCLDVPYYNSLREAEGDELTIGGIDQRTCGLAKGGFSSGLEDCE
jgi:hypothetical protein